MSKLAHQRKVLFVAKVEVWLAVCDKCAPSCQVVVVLRSVFKILWCQRRNCSKVDYRYGE